MPKPPRRHDEHALKRAFGRVDSRLRLQEGRVITGGGTSSGSTSGVWDVTRNGVVGNGTSDDTAALQALLDSKVQAGDELFIPPGAYVKVSDQITLPRRVRIAGAGTLHQAAPNKPLLTIGPQAAGSEIIGVTLLGPQSAEYQAESKGVNLQGTSTGERTTGVRVRGATVQNWTFGVYAQYADDLQFLDSTFSDLSYAGVHAFSSDRGLIRGCTIRDVIMAPGKSICYGITLSRYQVGTIGTDPWSQEWLVDGNKIYNVPWEGIDTHAGIRITIANNLVWNAFVGIAVVSGPNELDQPVHGPRDCKVHGNTVVWPADDGLSRAGIQVVGAQAGTDPATGCSVTGNTIRNYGNDIGDSGVGGVVAYFTEGLSISGNVILLPVYAGINLFRSNGGFSVLGNTVMDAYANDPPPPATTLGYACHTVVRGSENSFGVIAGNSIRTSGNKVSDYVNTRGVVVGSGAASVIEIGHNDFRTTVPANALSDGLGTRTSSRLLSPMYGVRGSTPIAKPTVTSTTTLEQLKQILEDQGLINYVP